MSEQPVMWVGKKPKAQAPPPNPAEDETFQAALNTACAAASFEVRQFLAAQGNYGSWLVTLSRGSDAYRLIWDGRLRQFRVEQDAGNNNWHERVMSEPADQEQATLIASLTEALNSCTEDN